MQINVHIFCSLLGIPMVFSQSAVTKTYNECSHEDTMSFSPLHLFIFECLQPPKHLMCIHTSDVVMGYSPKSSCARTKITAAEINSPTSTKLNMSTPQTCRLSVREGEAGAPQWVSVSVSVAG